MRSTSWLKTGCVALLVIAISATGSGCGSSNARGKVKGRVKFFDKYLTAGDCRLYDQGRSVRVRQYR